MRSNNLLKLISTLALILTLSMGLTAKNYQVNITLGDSSEVYVIVDEMPEIIGGISVLYDNIEYPDIARKSGVQGRVFVRFIVEEDGTVSSPEILKDIGAGCGTAAVNALKNMKFTPAKLNGDIVRVFYTLPITFKIAT